MIVPTDDGEREVIIAQENLIPTAFYYDPNLFDTTLKDVLAGSAINGFDKGLEAIYLRFVNLRNRMQLQSAASSTSALCCPNSEAQRTRR